MKDWKKKTLYFGPLVLAALQCYYGDNKYKMRTFFQKLVLTYTLGKYFFAAATFRGFRGISFITE